LLQRCQILRQLRHARKPLLAEIGADAFADVLERFAKVPSIYRLADEIESATPRMSELARSIKEYSYMEQKLIPNSKYRVAQSLWAHFTMFWMTPSDREQIDACIADLLNEPAEIGSVDAPSVPATRRAPMLRTDGPQPWAG